MVPYPLTMMYPDNYPDDRVLTHNWRTLTRIQLLLTRGQYRLARIRNSLKLLTGPQSVAMTSYV